MHTHTKRSLLPIAVLSASFFAASCTPYRTPEPEKLSIDQIYSKPEAVANRYIETTGYLSKGTLVDASHDDPLYGKFYIYTATNKDGRNPIQVVTPKELAPASQATSPITLKGSWRINDAAPDTSIHYLNHAAYVASKMHNPNNKHFLFVNSWSKSE